MFGLFKRKLDPLSRPGVAMIRSHTRALIRSANRAESVQSRVVGASDSGTQHGTGRQAMAADEAQLAGSIAAALSVEVSIQSIKLRVIRPMLKEATIVSDTAHDAVMRAVAIAEGGQ
ncbi:MAG: hypothetical protein K0U93_27045 [Gammaproteobacteria bacterium]|nr:hypothetical protein [Gammaproteobacteria bacterium]